MKRIVGKINKYRAVGPLTRLLQNLRPRVRRAATPITSVLKSGREEVSLPLMRQVPLRAAIRPCDVLLQSLRRLLQVLRVWLMRWVVRSFDASSRSIGRRRCRRQWWMRLLLRLSDDVTVLLLRLWFGVNCGGSMCAPATCGTGCQLRLVCDVGGDLAPMLLRFGSGAAATWT